MFYLKRLVRVGVLVGALVTGVSGSAYAVSQPKSYSGSGHSTNSKSGKTVYACDRETDGHPVNAEYIRTGNTVVQTVRNNAGNGTCESVGLSSVVYTHRIVEIVPLSIDDYGPAVFPQ